MDISSASKKPIIGIATTDFFNSYQRSIWDGIKHEAKKQNARIFCFLGGAVDVNIDSYKNRTEIYNLITKKNIDILLIMTGSVAFSSNKNEILHFIKKFSGIPIVSIAYALPGIPSIIIDNFGGMYKIVNHLVTDHSCREIAFIKGPDHNEEAGLRFDAYKQCLADHNIEYNEKLVYHGNFWHNDGENAIQAFLDERKVYFDALVGSDDRGIFFSLSALQKRDIQIPGDVKVTGFDDIEMSQYATPPLTTVKQPLFEIGVTGVQLALKILNKEKVPDVINIDTHLIIRESCGCKQSLLLDTLFLNDNNRIKSDDLQIDALYNILEKKIEGSYYKNLAQSKLHGFIKENLEEIIHLITSSLNNFEAEKLFINIEKIMLRTFNKGYNTSFWINIVTTITNELLKYNLDHDKLHILEAIQNNIKIILFKLEARFQAYQRLHQYDINQFLIRLGNKLSAICALEKMSSILREELSAIGIHHCTIALYNDRDEKSHLIFYSGPLNPKDVEYKTFNTKNIFPDVLLQDNHRSYIILPLITEETNFGFITFEVTDIPEVTFEHLTEQISLALSTIKTMEKMTYHSFELEKRVVERTKELELTVKHLKEESFKDELTGLKNRRYLMEVVLPETQVFIQDFIILTQTEHHKRNCYALFMIDLDHFKSVNDTFGHDAGDAVLVQLADIFKSVTGKHDSLIRLGGEEFLIIMKDFCKNDLADIAEKIRSTVDNHDFMLPNDRILNKTCSIGCVTYPLNSNHPDTVEFLSATSLADKALYYSKENGRNQSTIIELNEKFYYNAGMIDQVFDNLDKCIEENIITLYNSEESLIFNNSNYKITNSNE